MKRETKDETIKKTASKETKKAEAKSTVTVTAHALNIRESASLEAPVIKTAHRGEILVALGETTPGWLKTPAGYVMSKYTEANK